VDYLVEGHAHHAHEGHWDECDPSVFGDRAQLRD
jgi:UDP-2,3-diacylglucosamine pyrophosphatase LpxH